MLVVIPDVLDKEQIRDVRAFLDKATFVDGKLSAGQAARRVKNNQELDPETARLEQLNNAVMGTLLQHPVYQAAALPSRVATPYYARYTQGMRYGDHVDDPVMGPPGGQYRSDVSTTLFLTEPDEYTGGELVIGTEFGDQRIKPAAGSAVVYPSSSLHRIDEVTDGVRLVVVTWAQSLVREPDRRALLYKLYQARETLMQTRPGCEETTQVDHCYVNLMRMWAAP
jgi:PKHD-type hydroxylase